MFLPHCASSWPAYRLQADHITKLGTTVLDDAFFHFIPGAFVEHQLTVLKFDRRSILTEWTLGAFEKFIASQHSLRVVVIPRYVLTNVQSGLREASRDPNQTTKLFNILARQRKRMVQQQVTRLLDKSELTSNINMVLHLRRPDLADSNSYHTLEVFAHCGAPISVLRQLLDHGNNGTTLEALTIAKKKKKQAMVAMGRQLLDLGLETPIALKELRLSGMDLGAFGRHINKDLSLPALELLTLHNCSKELLFFQHLASATTPEEARWLFKSGAFDFETLLEQGTRL